MKDVLARTMRRFSVMGEKRNAIIKISSVLDNILAASNEEVEQFRPHGFVCMWQFTFFFRIRLLPTPDSLFLQHQRYNALLGFRIVNTRTFPSP